MKYMCYNPCPKRWMVIATADYESIAYKYSGKNLFTDIEAIENRHYELQSVTVAEFKTLHEAKKYCEDHGGYSYKR